MTDIQIHIQYRSRVFPRSPGEMEMLEGLLRQECAQRFTHVHEPLEPENFSVYYEQVGGMSNQTHDVIIRITLNDFEARVLSGGRDASELAEQVYEYLNPPMMHMLYPRDVLVSLVFAKITSASVSKD